MAELERINICRDWALAQSQRRRGPQTLEPRDSGIAEAIGIANTVDLTTRLVHERAARGRVNREIAREL